MRPVRLQLGGFTAFRDETAIDFQGLDLFAITGPTGAGKSSLLDAITYALYGKVPRVGNRVSQLISQGQPRLRVLLEFDVGKQRFRVTRTTPARGASTILFERETDGEWVSFGEGADRITDANALIEGVVGLDYETFTRSVLLPQGQFAEFLTQDRAARREILSELLGLELFERMAKRAGELSRGARDRGQAKSDVVASTYAGVDAEAAKAAKVKAKEARARSEALAAAVEAVGKLAERWVAELRRAEDLRDLGAEWEHVALGALTVADGLERLEGELAAAREVVARALVDVARAEAGVEAASTARARREGELGTLESLARLRAGAEALERSERHHAEASAALAGARAAVDQAETALREANRSVTESGAALEEARRKREAAERWRDEMTARHAAATLTIGMRPGQPCPVCGHPLDMLPERTEHREVEAAEKAFQLAGDGERQAEAAWARADKDAFAADADLSRARSDVARCQTQLEEWEREREGLAAQLAAALGGTLPADIGRTLDERSDTIRALAEAEAEAGGVLQRTQAAATAAREAAADGGARCAELVGGLRGLPLPRLIERTRRLVTDVEVPAELVSAIASEPTEAAFTARAIGEAAREVSTRMAHTAGRTQERLAELLGEAMATLPADLTVPGRPKDPAEILAALREASLEQVAAATAAEQEAKLGAERLKARRTLEKEIEGHRTEATILSALADELRANRLIDFLQLEALRLLAAAGSERLQFLSQGRYRLVFDDDEFSVEDRLNGDERRSVRTLSGGETFLASLALALALSEQHRSLAVTDRAPLESLFIDEGFGALDPESLEIASEALGQLGGEDRMVGVVTHVHDLAERLPVRVEVHREGRGSTIVVS